MVKHDRKGGCGRWRWLLLSVVAGVALAVAAWVATGDLPWHPVHEVRYEFRVRSWLRAMEKGEEVPREVLQRSAAELKDSWWLYGELRGMDAPEGLECRVRYDNTERIVLRVRGADSALTAEYGEAWYAAACEAAECVGEAAECVGEARLLNGAELPDARRTVARGWVIIYAFVAGLFFAICCWALRKKANG